MLKNKRVRLDEMMPDPNNPRSSFEGLDTLAESFAYTPDRPGEPFTPPIVVQDGNRYRIVDGERRYRAMSEAGKVTSCLVSVADTLEEANAVAMMMATDDKEPLTERERAAGVQQMLVLGVDFEQVEKLGGLKEGQGKKVKQALTSAHKDGPVPVQADMDTLIEIAELENPHRMGELMGMLEDPECETGWGSEFKKALSGYRDEKKGIDEKRQIVDAAEAKGWKVVPEGQVPDGYEAVESAFAWGLEDVLDGVDDEGFDVGKCVVEVVLGGRLDQRNQWGQSPSTRAIVHAPADDVARIRQADEEGPDEQSPAKAEAKELAHAYEEHVEALEAWVVERSESLGATPIGKRAAKQAEQDIRRICDKRLLDALEDRPGEPFFDYSPWMLADLWPSLCPTFEGDLFDALCGIEKGYDNSYYTKRAADAIMGLLDLATASGFEADDWWISLSDRIAAWQDLLSSKDGDGDAEDDGERGDADEDQDGEGGENGKNGDR